MGCSHSYTAISCGSAADEERRRVQDRCIRRLIHQLSTLRERVSVTELEASAQLSSFLSGTVRRRGLRKAPKQRVDACCAQPKSVIDFQLVVCGAVVKGDAVLISDKRDKQHILCTATQSFSTVIGSAAKGYTRKQMLTELVVLVGRRVQSTNSTRGLRLFVPSKANSSICKRRPSPHPTHRSSLK